MDIYNTYSIYTFFLFTFDKGVDFSSKGAYISSEKSNGGSALKIFKNKSFVIKTISFLSSPSKSTINGGSCFHFGISSSLDNL